MSSLVTVEGWSHWWQAWAPRIAEQSGREGWILFLLDAVEEITTLEGTMSRILRDKPEWNTALWAEQEWLDIEHTAGSALNWYDRNCPRLDRVPEWAAFVLCAMRGHITVLARLGKELRAAQEQGYGSFVVESNAEKMSMNVIKGGDHLLGEVE
jgi:hypothetical protein